MQLMGALKNVPLIVMADSDTPSALFHGLKIGAVDFLKRPLDEAKVRSMWQHTLQKVPVCNGRISDCDFREWRRCLHWKKQVHIQGDRPRA